MHTHGVQVHTTSFSKLTHHPEHGFNVTVSSRSWAACTQHSAVCDTTEIQPELQRAEYLEKFFSLKYFLRSIQLLYEKNHLQAAYREMVSTLTVVKK